MVRRLATEYKLCRMWTLTLADATTLEERANVVRLVLDFAKRGQRRWPGMKWVAVLEWHPGGHGWHVHMLVNRYVPKDLVRAVWGLGHTDVRLIRARGVKTALEGSRLAAAYAAKYLAKDAESGRHQRGDHRYLRPEGMAISEVEFEATFAECCRLIWERFSGRVSFVWWSGDDEDWAGPPVLSVRSG